MQDLAFAIAATDKSTAAFGMVHKNLDKTQAMVSETNRELAKLRASMDGIDRSRFGQNIIPPALPGQLKLNAGQVQNLSFQLNDMAVMLASGQSPFVMLMQQGMQVAQIFESGTGVKAAMKATGAALIGFLVNPLTLAVVGFAAAAGGASMFFHALGSGAEKADEALKQHDDIMRRLRESYKDAGQEIIKYNGTLDQTLLLEKRLSDAQIARLLKAEQQKLSAIPGVADETSSIAMAMSGGLGDTMGFGVTSKFGPFAQQFEQIVHANAQGIRDIRQEVARLGVAGTETDAAFAKMFLDATAGLAKLAGATATFDRTMSRTMATSNMLAFNAANEIAANDMKRAQAATIASINARTPAERAAAARDAVLAEPINPAESDANRRLRAENAAATSLAESYRSLADAQKDRALSLEETVKAAQLDIDLIGKSVAETARLTTENQLLAQLREEAARNGTVIDAAEVARIKEKAAETGNLKQQYAELTALRDLAFDRAQMFRSSTEQAVASQLRSIYGDGWEREMNGAIAAQIRFNETLRQSRDLVADFAHTFVNDLREGKSTAEALGDAITRLADKLLDMAMDQAINSLFGSIGKSGSTSLLGSVFSGLGKLFGFANGGEFTVGGSGGTDSQLVAFRASPNEQVSIRRPGQQAAGAQVIKLMVATDVSPYFDTRVKVVAAPQTMQLIQESDRMQQRQQQLAN
jgi:hypothetical protein